MSSRDESDRRSILPAFDMDSRSDLNYLGSVCNPRSSRILTETRVVFRQAGLPVQDAGLGPTYYHYLAGVFFLQWWYVLTKPKNEPRSLQGFFTLVQTSDPRHLRMWGFIIPGMINAFAIALSASYWGNDSVEAVSWSLMILAAPIFAIMACVWTYGFPSPSDHDSHSSSD